MKIESINVVKESEIPAHVPKNTELAATVNAILEAFKTVPPGSAATFKLTGAKKHTRFGLQQRLNARGLKCIVTTADRMVYTVRRGQPSVRTPKEQPKKK